MWVERPGSVVVVVATVCVNGFYLIGGHDVGVFLKGACFCFWSIFFFNFFRGQF
jgi:hypothetical protein